MFDMDGVLVDSEPLWFRAETAVMARLGGSWAEGDQHVLVGGSMAVTVAYLLERGTRAADPADVERWLVDSMAEMLSSGPLPVMPGAGELVEQVSAAGLPYALVTSSERVIMDAVLSGFGAAFPVTVCADDVSACKPDPEGYLLAAAKLSVEPRPVHCHRGLAQWGSRGRGGRVPRRRRAQRRADPGGARPRRRVLAGRAEPSAATRRVCPAARGVRFRGCRGMARS